MFNLQRQVNPRLSYHHCCSVNPSCEFPLYISNTMKRKNPLGTLQDSKLLMNSTSIEHFHFFFKRLWIKERAMIFFSSISASFTSWQQTRLYDFHLHLMSTVHLLKGMIFVWSKWFVLPCPLHLMTFI